MRITHYKFPPQGGLFNLMSREVFFQNVPGPEVRRGPFQSATVVCRNCDSVNFAIDPIPQRRGNVVPGQCEDCGHHGGRRLPNVQPQR